ncbi:hypothetical protein ACFPOE_05470 [Caenimonas terrae]|uniref:Uncharacterized protein n=1 Tax=Caenimonas terrae TaxID=696074 RepID=A0ABW0NDG7_9BURK
MNRPAARHALAGAAAALLALLAAPASRQLLESGMTVQMLVQYPLLAGCGALLAGALPAGWRIRIARWNALGISGLLATALVLGLLMIPRLLDLALLDGRVELAKWLALVLCGAALRLSWRPAGLLVQGFFLGNVLPMTAVAGYLYQDSPLRLCNAYLLDDQLRLGQALVAICVALALGWLAAAVLALMRREAAALAP